jgi:hypothetical protein
MHTSSGITFPGATRFHQCKKVSSPLINKKKYFHYNDQRLNMLFIGSKCQQQKALYVKKKCGLDFWMHQYLYMM